MKELTLFDLPAGPTILSLVDRFVVPPFTVLDARQGYWQDRKRAWIDLGIKSELGREDMGGGYQTAAVRDPNFYRGKEKWEKENGRKIDTTEYRLEHYAQPDTSYSSGASIFDPVLCEVAYRWFSPRGGKVLDPFAGGSVRGIVAGVLGRRYFGIDLSAPQVASNREQSTALQQWIPEAPYWTVGDSRAVLAGIERLNADLLFTCPPYFDLEVYSDDPRDLSRMDYTGFQDAYYDILRLGVDHLAHDAFAIVVIGNVRDKEGRLRDLVGDTVAAMRHAGADYYNDAILVTATGTLPMRANLFTVSRKLGRGHQMALVFVKGDPRVAAQRCGVLGAADAGVVDIPDNGAGK